MPGRHRKPFELRVIEGNRSKRDLPPESTKAVGKPKMPEWLEERAASRVGKKATALWARYSAMLPWLGESDSELLAVWCWMSGEFQCSPGSFNSAQIAQLRYLSADLGIGPAARTRMGGAGALGAHGKSKGSESKADSYFAS